MKSCYILTIAALAILNSCGSMSEAIYYNDGTRKGPLQSQNSSIHIKKGFSPSTSIQPQRQDVLTNKKEPQRLTASGPFIQPDVFKIPDKSELKETETTTHLNQSKPGLTVPQRQ